MGCLKVRGGSVYFRCGGDFVFGLMGYVCMVLMEIWDWWIIIIVRVLCFMFYGDECICM